MNHFFIRFCGGREESRRAHKNTPNTDPEDRV